MKEIAASRSRPSVDGAGLSRMWALPEAKRPTLSATRQLSAAATAAMVATSVGVTVAVVAKVAVASKTATTEAMPSTQEVILHLLVAPDVTVATEGRVTSEWASRPEAAAGAVVAA